MREMSVLEHWDGGIENKVQPRSIWEGQSEVGERLTRSLNIHSSGSSWTQNEIML